MAGKTGKSDFVNGGSEEKPLISIAMPVFNGAETLEAALRSILHQTYDRWELWLIDDGSSDASAAVAAGFHDPRIRILADGERRGHGPRLNEAIDLSRGAYIARMDQDDISFPERFERQVDYLERHPEIDLLGTGALVFSDTGAIRGLFPLRTSHDEICRRPWSGFYLPHPTWMGRTEWFRKFRYGGPEALRAEDQDMLLRSYDESRFACLPDVLFGYRQNMLPMKSVLAGRRSLVRSVIREAWRKRRYGRIPLAVAGQAAKGLAEWGVCSLNLEGHLLGHRARPVSDEALERRWQCIWDRVIADTPGHRAIRAGEGTDR
jgi:glycosyltransferase involved in cell wall biosynthesis